MEDMLAKLDLEMVRGAAFKVVIDYNNGAAAMVLPQILRELNCTVIRLNAAPAETRTVRGDIAGPISPFPSTPSSPSRVCSSCWRRAADRSARCGPASHR